MRFRIFDDFDSGHFENRFLAIYQLIVNSLIMTWDMSLNKMIPVNGSPGDILNHKSQLQKCIDVIFLNIFLDSILDYTESIIIWQLEIVSTYSLTT